VFLKVGLVNMIGKKLIPQPALHPPAAFVILASPHLSTFASQNSLNFPTLVV